MKNLLFGAMALFLMASCSGNGSSEKAKEDSARIADSLSHVEAIKEAEEAIKLADAAIEQARLDSIEKVQLALNAIPTFNEIVSSRNTEKLFKNKGFKVSVKQEYYEGDAEYYPHVKATYNPGNGISCKYSDWLLGFTITIKGAPELLDRFYADAQSYIAAGKRKEADGSIGWRATRKGDTIDVYLPDIG